MSAVVLRNCVGPQDDRKSKSSKINVGAGFSGLRIDIILIQVKANVTLLE
jgi:hypothetical protein